MQSATSCPNSAYFDAASEPRIGASFTNDSLHALMQRGKERTSFDARQRANLQLTPESTGRVRTSAARQQELLNVLDAALNIMSVAADHDEPHDISYQTLPQ
jgi:hypothetical protein